MTTARGMRKFERLKVATDFDERVVVTWLDSEGEVHSVALLLERSSVHDREYVVPKLRAFMENMIPRIEGSKFGTSDD